MYSYFSRFEFFEEPRWYRCDTCGSTCWKPSSTCPYCKRTMRPLTPEERFAAEKAEMAINLTEARRGRTGEAGIILNLTDDEAHDIFAIHDSERGEWLPSQLERLLGVRRRHRTSSEQIAGVRRLEFARYLVSTGRISR